MQTPRLKIRMVGRRRRIFRAGSLRAFRPRYRAALASPAGSEIRADWRKVLTHIHVYESGYGTGWAMLHAVGMAWVPEVNRAATDPAASLGRSFPSYDLHRAVAQAGGPAAWLRSEQAIWMMAQVTWAWGRELRLVGDAVTEEAFTRIAEDREAATGLYQVRPVRSHEAN